MSFIIRSMLHDGDGPLVGSDDNMLGVRVPPHPRADVTLDEDGYVSPAAGGLSINQDWKRMHVNHIPSRYKHLVMDARGSNKKSLWQLGSLAFANGPISDGLELRITSENHGLIEAAEKMMIDKFQGLLQDTRPQWSAFEPSA